MTLFDVNQAAAIIRETAHPDVNMIFGAVIDPNMSDEIRITVIATGFERASMPRRVDQRPAINTNTNATHKPLERQQQAPAPQRPQTTSQTGQNIPLDPRQFESVTVTPAPSVQPASINPPEFKAQPSYQEDLDIPTFLRNRR